MNFAARFEKLVPDLSAAFIRFPVPALFSVALCIYVNTAGFNSEHDNRVIAGAAAAFFAAGAAHLCCEGWKHRWPTSLLIALAAAAAAALLGYLPQVFETNLLFLFLGLVPLLMISPYLRPGIRQGAIWLFNLRLGLAAMLAALVALLFALGLSAIVATLDVLFGTGLNDVHEHIWSTAMSLVAPLYALSLVPRELNEEVDISPHTGSLLDRGISVLVNYIAVPVIAVYTLILHAYALKIVLEGQLPEGQIGMMVTIFAVGGTATWLVAWPWREQGSRLLRIFMRSWFFFLIVPAILLGIAIWRRLADYGFTPDRYGIALVAIWVAALALYLAVRRNRADMRAILGAVAVLLLVGSVGPMGANGLTIKSQYDRLVALLENAGVLKEGKLQPKSLLPPDVSSQGNSMLYALKDAGGLERLRPWFEGEADILASENEWTIVSKIGDRLGFNQSTTSEDYVTFNANLAGGFKLPGGAELLGPFQNQRIYDPSQKQQPMTAVDDKDTLTIMLEDRTFKVSLRQLLKVAKASLAAKPSSQRALSVDIEPGTTMLIDQISGNLATSNSLGSIRFWIIRQQQP